MDEQSKVETKPKRTRKTGEIRVYRLDNNGDLGTQVELTKKPATVEDAMSDVRDMIKEGQLNGGGYAVIRLVKRANIGVINQPIVNVSEF
jgi:uncharacterized membrane protein